MEGTLQNRGGGGFLKRRGCFERMVIPPTLVEFYMLAWHRSPPNVGVSMETTSRLQPSWGNPVTVDFFEN